MTDKAPAASLAEIRGLLDALPAVPDTVAPPGPLGLLGALRQWLAACQGRKTPRLDRPRLAVFLGAAGGTADIAAAQEMVAAFQEGAAPAARLATVYDAELRLYEMALESSGEDGDSGLSDAACATALAYGMTAVDDGVDLLCVSAAGPGVARAADMLCAALYGLAPSDPPAVPAGTAVEDDPLTVLRRYGGHAMAAAAGAMIAARMGRVPVLVDGLAATAAAAVLGRLDASFLDHCLIGHASPAPSYRGLLDLLDKEPLLDLGIETEDGSGALVALGVLRAAQAGQDE